MRDGRCANHWERDVHAPSEVLCAECLDALDRKMHGLLGKALVVHFEAGDDEVLCGLPDRPVWSLTADPALVTCLGCKVALEGLAQP